MSVWAREVTAYLALLEPPERAIVLAARELVRRVAPDAEETVLWGGLSYHMPWVGGRVKGALCQISVRRGAVQLAFIHGVRLADPTGLLKGEAKSKRHVPLVSVEDASRPEVVALIREASEVELAAP